MRMIHKSQTISVPEGVTLVVKARQVTVKGPRGTLTKSFKHMSVDIFKLPNGQVQVEKWFGATKESASIRSACSHMTNMIIGVTKGFEYKMRFVYAHFPINVAIVEKDTVVEIRNFLGEKIVRRIQCHPGVTCTRSKDIKDEIVMVGNDIDNVSLSASLINQSCHVKNKDIRKFLDGIYISERNVIGGR
ncbi:60s ribosomal protein l9 [Pavlovales sp. CCMP2436]|nr:60s ribosomal protein l9 [Pavlovales sp. CCMP2436]